MLGYLRGTVAEIGTETVIIDVNGVGYELMVSVASQQILVLDAEVKLYTYLAVREDGVFLYGFATLEEKRMFLKLISISGIGPKVAISILSGIELSQLAMSIITGDSKTLSKIKGIGKKTAERIILELKESVEPIEGEQKPIKEDNPDIADAIQALRSLGITANDATKAVNEAAITAKSIEELITLSLQLLK